MYGTIARYTLKAGSEDEFLAELKRFEEDAPPGWVYHTFFRSAADPNELWASVVFESEDAYQRNADSPEMDERYRRMLDHLQGEPEWHDGSVIHEAMRKGAPA